MKKIFAFMLTLVMMLSLSGIVNAGKVSADTTTGSVTVSPNYKNQTYTLYKLFDAHITFKDDGTVAAITYTLPEGKDDLGAGTEWFKINSNGFVEAKDGSVTADWAKNRAAIDWAKSFGTQIGNSIKAASDNDANVKWENLEFGYYFVDSTLGSFIGIDSNTPDVIIQDKNAAPTIDKEITGVKDKDGNTSGSVFNADIAAEKTDVGSGVNEQAIAQIGDTVSYKLTITVKPGADNYVITDTMDNLALVSSSVKVDNDAYDVSAKVDNTTDGATVVSDAADNFTITLKKDWLDSEKTKDRTVVITYDAKLTKAAAVATAANPNTVELTWGDNPTDNYSEDQSKVWTAEVDVEKHIASATGDALEGAGFKLKKGELFYDLDADGNVIWDNVGKEIKTNAEGKLTEKFKGLANGTYTLVESTVPDGYNKLGDTVVTIAEKNASITNLSQTKVVINNTGSTLPSTGGIGTTIFYVLGGILMAAAVVLLITKKKMSAYKN